VQWYDIRFLHILIGLGNTQLTSHVTVDGQCLVALDNSFSHAAAAAPGAVFVFHQ
jgi:hypothetical protein